MDGANGVGGGRRTPQQGQQTGLKRMGSRVIRSVDARRQPQISHAPHVQEHQAQQAVVEDPYVHQAPLERVYSLRGAAHASRDGGYIGGNHLPSSAEFNNASPHPQYQQQAGFQHNPHQYGTVTDAKPVPYSGGDGRMGRDHSQGPGAGRNANVRNEELQESPRLNRQDSGYSSASSKSSKSSRMSGFFGGLKKALRSPSPPRTNLTSSRSQQVGSNQKWSNEQSVLHWFKQDIGKAINDYSNMSSEGKINLQNSLHSLPSQSEALKKLRLIDDTQAIFSNIGRGQQLDPNQFNKLNSLMRNAHKNGNMMIYKNLMMAENNPAITEHFNSAAPQLQHTGRIADMDTSAPHDPDRGNRALAEVIKRNGYEALTPQQQRHWERLSPEVRQRVWNQAVDIGGQHKAGYFGRHER